MFTIKYKGIRLSSPILLVLLCVIRDTSLCLRLCLSLNKICNHGGFVYFFNFHKKHTHHHFISQKNVMLCNFLLILPMLIIIICAVLSIMPISIETMTGQIQVNKRTLRWFKHLLLHLITCDLTNMSLENKYCRAPADTRKIRQTKRQVDIV